MYRKSVEDLRLSNATIEEVRIRKSVNLSNYLIRSLLNLGKENTSLYEYKEFVRRETRVPPQTRPPARRGQPLPAGDTGTGSAGGHLETTQRLEEGPIHGILFPEIESFLNAQRYELQSQAKSSNTRSNTGFVVCLLFVCCLLFVIFRE